MECGFANHDELVRQGPSLEVIINNQSGTIPVNRQLPALIDTGSEWNLIEATLAAGVLHLRHVDDQWIQTANGQTLAPVYSAQLRFPGSLIPNRIASLESASDRTVLFWAVKGFKISCSHIRAAPEKSQCNIKSLNFPPRMS